MDPQVLRMGWHHALTIDRFGPPFATKEGWNQGDNPLDDTCQVGKLVDSGNFPLLQDVQSSAAPGGVPPNNLLYSDDRRLVWPTLPAFVNLTCRSIRATIAKGGLVHMDKLRFFGLRLDMFDLRMQEALVLHYPTTTYNECSQIVGIAPPCLRTSMGVNRHVQANSPHASPFGDPPRHHDPSTALPMGLYPPLAGLRRPRVRVSP